VWKDYGIISRGKDATNKIGDTFKSLSAEECHSECIKNVECGFFVLGKDECHLVKAGYTESANADYDLYIAAAKTNPTKTP